MILKVCCEAAARFSRGDLKGSAIPVDGHSFIKTRFTLHSGHGTCPVFFCRCGELALQHDDVKHTIYRLADDGCELEVTHCSLNAD